MKKPLFLVLIFVLMVPLFQVSAGEDVAWTIEDTKVFIDDYYVYLSADPHTLSGSGWVEFTVNSKQFSGDVDVVWGFDTNTMIPAKAQRWSNYAHERERWVTKYTLEREIIIEEIDHFQNITVEEFLSHSERLGNQYNLEYYEVSGYIDNGLKRTYDTWYVGLIAHVGNLQKMRVTQTYTDKVRQTYTESFEDWKDWTPQVKVIKHNYLGMDTWYVLKNINIIANTEYKIRLWIDIIPQLGRTKGKYTWGIQKSNALHIREGYFLDPWYNPGWGFRKQINVTAGYITANLNNFPVLVNITDTDLRDDAQDDYDDVLFAYLDTTKLSHEIEDFDNTTGYLCAWVRVNLTAASDTVFYMYYGNAVCGSQRDAEATWDSNFVMVQHLNETGLDLTWRYDSTSQDSDLQVIDLTATGTGRIDGADDFERGNTDYETRGDDATLDLTTFTLEIWMRPEAFPAAVCAAFTKGENVNWNDANYALYTWNNDLYGLIGNGNELMSINQVDLQINKWYYVVFTMNNALDDARLYNNGTQVASNLTATIIPYTAGIHNTRLGADPFAPGNFYDGWLDEARISDVERPASFVTATWQNVNATDFLVWGAEESAAIYLTVNFNAGITQVLANGTNMLNGTETPYNSGENINVTSFPDFAGTEQFLKHTYNENGTITESLYNPYIDVILINSTIMSYAVIHPAGGGLPDIAILALVFAIPVLILALTQGRWNK